MPANLTPQYLAAELRFKNAATIPEKIEALEEMMAVIPKHKGTEKMRAALRQKMARLLQDKDKKGTVSKASAMYSVPREGAGQVVLIGAPNVGKSSLLARLTHATPEIADYPFTTRLPQPGMMPVEDIQIQLVDLPPVADEVYKPWVGSIVRQADLALMIVDLGSDELLEQVEDVLRILAQSNLHLVDKTPSSADDLMSGVVFRPALLIANKSDAAPAWDNLAILREFVGQQFQIVPISTVSGQGVEGLRHVIFVRLEIIRIYTKVPGKRLEPGTVPFVLKSGSTVLDVARAVHRDLVQTLRFARIWTSEKSKRSVKYDGQMVERTHRLEDGDILELHK